MHQYPPSTDPADICEGSRYGQSGCSKGRLCLPLGGPRMSLLSSVLGRAHWGRTTAVGRNTPAFLTSISNSLNKNEANVLRVGLSQGLEIITCRAMWYSLWQHTDISCDVRLACLKSEFKDLGSRKRIVTDVFVLPFPWHRAPQRGQEGV